jgi:hypothetical protein
MVEHPSDAGLAALNLQPRCEIVRRPVTLYGEKTKSILTWLIKSNGAAVEGDDAMQGFGDSVQEGLLGQVCDDGIVDLKECAVTLCNCEDLHARLGTRHLGRLFEWCSRQVVVSEKAVAAATESVATS